jgi:hypothetical protein
MFLYVHLGTTCRLVCDVTLRKTHITIHAMRTCTSYCKGRVVLFRSGTRFWPGTQPARSIGEVI